MSVTIADIMKLPSMSEAKVVAGHSGLGRTISSITVMEGYNPEILGKEQVSNIRSYGSELSITGFISIKDDVDAQYRIVEKMAMEGEAGIIVYYLGKIVKQLDKKIIDLAERLGLTVIVMPENRLELRYSDVICEVMETITKDRLTDTYFASEIMKKISHLHGKQRNINSVLSMLRDRIHCSLFIADEALRVLNGAEWPVERGLPVQAVLAGSSKGKPAEERIELCQVGEKYFWHSRHLVDESNGIKLHLYLIKETEGLTLDICRQAVDVIKTYLNLWAEDYGNIGAKQLVSTILRDEPEKMQRIAEILRIEIEKISTMMVLSAVKGEEDIQGGEKESRQRSLEMARDKIKGELAGCGGFYIAEIYEESVVIFTEYAKELQGEVTQRILQELKKTGYIYRAAIFDRLAATVDAKEAFEQFLLYGDIAELIYPQKDFFSGGEIGFAAKCQEICKRGSHDVFLAKRPISRLFAQEARKELLETMSVYLLDGDMRVSRTAELMFVHKNTIKYRMSCLEELLEQKIDKMPEAYDLSVAVALERIIKT